MTRGLPLHAPSPAYLIRHRVSVFDLPITSFPFIPDRSIARMMLLSSTQPARKKRTLAPDDDQIVWPPTIVVENTRLAQMNDGRWTGIGNSEMAIFLSGIGHTLGKPKSSWGKEGHRGQILVQYPPTLAGLREAERLHAHFKSHYRGREEWMRVKPFWHGLPGHEGIEEGPDFKRIDQETNVERRVLYGYLAVMSDLDKFPIQKKKHKKCKTVSKKEIEAMAVSDPSNFNTSIFA